MGKGVFLSHWGGSAMGQCPSPEFFNYDFDIKMVT